MKKIRLQLIAFATIGLMGCDTLRTISEVRDDDYDTGCIAVEAKAKTGLYGQNGEGAVCKLKCAKVLPCGYNYQYKNPYTGCKLSVKSKACEGTTPDPNYDFSDVEMVNEPIIIKLVR